MALTDAEIADLEDLSSRFVGAFVKCGQPPAKYSVTGIACFTLAEAVNLSIERCEKRRVDPIDKAEQIDVLRRSIEDAIVKLRCP